MKTGLVTSPFSSLHDTGRGHPERPARLDAIRAGLAASGALDQVEPLEAEDADRRYLERVHAKGYLDRVERAIASGSSTIDSPDTAVSPESWKAATHAAGGLLAALDRVARGAWKNAFVAARPPGHHAEIDLAMGFCLVNHVAVGARYLQDEHGLSRVAILDWDVHHGNGTQHLFERDPNVMYLSLHQYPHYPGTGAASERGKGEGEGTTVNCPMSPGTGDADWLRAFEDRVLPALEDFSPDFLIVSAGFDAHTRDPLSDTRLSSEAYGEMTRLACELAARRFAGRVVSFLEGGYDLEALAQSSREHVEALLRA